MRTDTSHTSHLKRTTQFHYYDHFSKLKKNKSSILCGTGCIGAIALPFCHGIVSIQLPLDCLYFYLYPPHFLFVVERNTPFRYHPVYFFLPKYTWAKCEFVPLDAQFKYRGWNGWRYGATASEIRPTRKEICILDSQWEEIVPRRYQRGVRMIDS